MGHDTWTKLAQPFPETALEWRVLRLDDEQLRAQVRPQLRLDALTHRLDETVGVAGWSHTLVSLGPTGSVACTLTVEGVSKSAGANLGPGLAASVLADDALVYAAERFHMLPPADLTLNYWVDYDKESGTTLYEPSRQPERSAEEGVPTEAPAATSTATSSETSGESKPAPKSAGQQAIDRLVERLKADGLGLQAAKLVIAYDGYGSNPDAARELYAKLRELLRSAGSA